LITPRYRFAVAVRLAAAAALCALAVPASSTPAVDAVPMLYAWSGRGELGVSRQGINDDRVRRLKAGVYRVFIVIRPVLLGERPMNFHLRCARFDRATPRGATRSFTWWVRLRPGTCRYFSDFGYSRPRSFSVF
jgi:hypothetical protein